MVLLMWSCYHWYESMRLKHLFERSYQLQSYRDFTRKKNRFFEGWSWFKLNNLGFVLGMAFKFYSSVAKGLKLKFKVFES